MHHDQSENANTERLKNLGIPVFIGHSASHVENVDVIVASSAIPQSNAEYAEGLKRKIPVIARAEALGEIMRLKRGIAVAVACRGKRPDRATSPRC